MIDGGLFDTDTSSDSDSDESQQNNANATLNGFSPITSASDEDDETSEAVRRQRKFTAHLKKMRSLLKKFTNEKDQLQVENSKLKTKLMEIKQDQTVLRAKFEQKEEDCLKLDEKVQVYEKKCLFLRKEIYEDMKEQRKRSLLSNSEDFEAQSSNSIFTGEIGSSSRSKKQKLNGIVEVPDVTLRKTEAPETYKENPMLNDLVLQNVMKYLPMESLLNCRLTCRQWKYESGKQLAKKSVVTFDMLSIDKLGEFEELSQKPSAFLFTNYKFSHFEVEEYLAGIVQFLAVFGFQIRSLTLHFERDSLTLEQLTNIFLLSVPNIEILRITSLVCNLMMGAIFEDQVLRLFKLQQIELKLNCDCEVSHFTYGCIRDLLLMAPNLESLKVEPYNVDGGEDTIAPIVIRAIASLHDNDNIEAMGAQPMRLKLKHLALDYPLGDEGSTMLTTITHLNLVSLELQGTTSVILPFLEKQAHLIRLRLFSNGNNWLNATYIEKLAKCRKLEQLAISCFDDRVEPLRRCIFRIKSGGPQLQKVAVLGDVMLDSGLLSSDNCLEEGSLFSAGSSSMSQVSSQGSQEYKSVNKVLLYDEVGDTSQMFRCITLFPNIGTLEMAPSEIEVLCLIWIYLPHLNDLTLYFPPTVEYDIESGIIGISAANCKMLRDDPLLCSLMGSLSNCRILNHMRSEPSICNLTKLRKLSVNIFGNEYLTDLVIDLCFLKMNSLYSIDVNRYKGSPHGHSFMELKAKLSTYGQMSFTHVN